MNDIRLLYIADTGLFSSVFDSQVCGFLKHIGNYVDEIHLLVLEPYNQKYYDKVRKDEKIKDLLTYFSVVEIYSMPPLLGVLSLRYAVHGVCDLLQTVSRPTLIHSRGHIGSYVALMVRGKLFKDVPLLTDLRGVTRDEFLYSAKKWQDWFLAKLRTVGFSQIEKKLVTDSDHLFCVSNNFANYICKIHSLLPEDVSVVPTLTDSKMFYFDIDLRKQVRHDLGIDDRVVFIYSGSLAPWQMAKETVSLFCKIKKHLPQSYLIFLTNEPIGDLSLFEGISDLDYIVINSKYSYVNAYLNASDIALLLRESNIVNVVSSPTKIGEYLCSGLPLIISSGVGDMDEYLKFYPVGVSLDNSNSDIKYECIKGLLGVDRNYISDIGVKVFGFNSYISTIIKVYCDLTDLCRMHQ